MLCKEELAHGVCMCGAVGGKLKPAAGAHVARRHALTKLPINVTRWSYTYNRSLPKRVCRGGFRGNPPLLDFGSITLNLCRLSGQW